MLPAAAQCCTGHRTGHGADTGEKNAAQQPPQEDDRACWHIGWSHSIACLRRTASMPNEHALQVRHAFYRNDTPLAARAASCQAGKKALEFKRNVVVLW
jgi:hypothetical protein